MSNNKRTARIAGILYLIVAITGFFSSYANGKIILKGDAVGTATNIINDVWFFRFSILVNLIMVISWILLAFVLYKLFETVSKGYGLMMVTFVSVGSAIICINIINKFAALLVLNGADYFKEVETGQLQGVAMLFLDFYKSGNIIVYIFFGLWLLPLAYLIIKSGFIPKILGWLLIVAGVGYLIDFFIFFLFPNVAITIVSFTFWGEVLLLLWLLIKGVVVPKVGQNLAH